MPEPRWSDDERDFLCEFIWEENPGGKSSQDLTWLEIAKSMNNEGLTRGVSQRVYTARKYRDQYSGVIRPYFEQFLLQ
jgi:hypothetical protein